MNEVLCTHDLGSPRIGEPRELKRATETEGKCRHIRDILARDGTAISFEFFPPRNAGNTLKLFETIAELATWKPDFISVTYGAGGSTRDLTHDLAVKIKQEAGLEVIPHLTCLGHSEEEILAILRRYAEAGIGNLLALRGDPPRDQSYREGGFANAGDLVRAIRNFRGHPCPDGFGIGVAGFPEGHPSTRNRLREMDYLKAKVDAGADYICTQLFFDNRDFYDFRERCELAGIRVPIVAGILPLVSAQQMQRVADFAAGARFPARLLKSLSQADGDAAGFADAGIAYATEQCTDLLAKGVSGLHFYTLNQPKPARRILESLKLNRSHARPRHDG